MEIPGGRRTPFCLGRENLAVVIKAVAVDFTLAAVVSRLGPIQLVSLPYGADIDLGTVAHPDFGGDATFFGNYLRQGK